MKGNQPEDLMKVGFYVTSRAGEPFSVGQLAKALGVSFVTARRRLQAYAAQSGLELEPGRARVGGRGPQSTTWRLRPPAPFRAAAPPPVTPGASPVLDSARTERRGEVLDSARTERRGEVLDSARTERRGEVPAVVVPALPFTDRPGFTPDENRALDLLALTGTARTTELSQRLHHNPGYIDGFMRYLLRKLFARGTPLFTSEKLPSGEWLYRALEGPVVMELLKGSARAGTAG